jgi:hypothetical protein
LTDAQVSDRGFLKLSAEEDYIYMKLTQQKESIERV